MAERIVLSCPRSLLIVIVVIGFIAERLDEACEVIGELPDIRAFVFPLCQRS